MTRVESGAEIGAALPPNPGANELEFNETTSPAGGQSGLFGRGLLYVVVFSFQTLAATIVSPILAHTMGPVEFGRLASAMALYQLLCVLAVLGLDQALVIQRAEDGDSKRARGLVAFSLAVITLIVVAAAATAPLWSEALGYGGFSTLLLATFLWTGPSAAVHVMLSLLLAEDRLKSFTAISAVSAVGGQVLGIVLILVIGRDATLFVWGGVASQVLAGMVAVVVTRPRLRGLVELRLAGRALRLGAPLAISALSAFVLNAGDRIVIQRFLGSAEVGRYQIAYTVGYVVVLLMVFVSQAWTPRFAALRDPEKRLALAELARNELYQLLVPMIVGITLAAPIALRIVAPASFRPESLALVVFLVALSAIPVAASGATGRELLALRRGRSIALVACIAAAANVGLNLALVPLFGIAGSAAATVAAFGLAAVLQLLLLPRTPRWPRTPARLWLVIVLGCAVSGATLALPQTMGWNIARLAAGACCVPWLWIRLRIARQGPTS